MATKRDYYEVLGVTKTSSPDEVKQQYRKLALKFHPDRNQSNRNQFSDAGEHFKEISEAYAVISDLEKNKSMINMAMLMVMVILVKKFFKEHDDENLIPMMQIHGITKAVQCIFLEYIMKQSHR